MSIETSIRDYLNAHGIKQTFISEKCGWTKQKTNSIVNGKLANYGLDRWLTLPKYVPEKDTRMLLKNCYRQYQQYSKVKTMLKNNLISLLDTTFPDVNQLFRSPARADGSEKWVDFATYQ